MNKPGALLLLAALLLCGCTYGSIGSSSCEMSGADPPCPMNERCPGQCAPLPPLGWSLPVLLWSGPALEAPECPVDWEGITQYEGYADPIDPPKCPVCSCDPPTGECALPAFMFASTQSCIGEGPGPTVYDFSDLNPDPMTCNTNNAVAAVEGPQSLTLGPLRMTESGCKPVATLPPRSGATPWKTFARACGGDEVSACPDTGALCIPMAEPSPGFSRCVHKPGEHQCPSGYPDRRVFYDEVSDSRHCSACSCGVSEGGGCKAYLEAYQDAFCSVFAAGFTIQLWTLCHDTGDGFGLGSKRLVSAPIYEPGVCEPSGGELTGSLELKGPTTFCCQ